MRRPVLLATLVVALAGCGGSETASPTPETIEGENPAATQAETQPSTEGNPEEGKSIYAANGCGSCHTLEDAGSEGKIGPNLDESQPDLQLAIDRITNGKDQMPPFKDELTEQQIADVATYVVQATQG